MNLCYNLCLKLEYCFSKKHHIMSSNKSGKELERTLLDAYEKYSNSVFKFILFKINNRERSLEILQEVFMKTWIHMSNNDQIENIRAFLYKVAGNLVIDEYRKRNRMEYKTESLDKLHEDGFEPSQSVDVSDSFIDRMDGLQVMELVRDLPEMYANVLFMKYTEELSISEIAESAGVSENVVSVRLNRAMSKLRNVLDIKLKKYKK